MFNIFNVFKHKKNNGIELESDGQLKIELSRKEKKELKKQLKKEKKDLRKAQREVDPNVMDLMPILDLHDDFIKTETGFMNIYQVDSKDVSSLNEDELERHIRDFTYFLKAYQDDIKFVCMQFPVNTKVQQDNINKKIENTTNIIHITFLQKRLWELKELEKKRFNKEFFIFMFSNENIDEAIERENLLFRLSNNSIPLFKIDEEKKLKILFKLCNLNSKI